MPSIAWIEDLPENRDDYEIHSLVDPPLAIQIAGDEELHIDDVEEKVREFTRSIPDLLIWFHNHYREFPWRRTRDPWEVLMAEILLQRTHAEHVAQIYLDFLEKYPTPREVYRASDSEIFDVVESLGFGNKRTSTIRELAKALVEHHGGKVPRDIDELLKLPRIGPYTSRACMCFSFGEPLSLIDSNVEVVIARVFDHSSSRRAHKDQSLYRFLDALVPEKSEFAMALNLAILDLRDAVCVDPPRCDECPLQPACTYAIAHEH